MRHVCWSNTRLGFYSPLISALLMMLGVASPALANELVTINCTAGSASMTQRAGGFLHGVSATLPTVDRVNPLKPKLIRAGSYMYPGDTTSIVNSYGRIQSTGATHIQALLSGDWGYYNPANGGWPYDNYAQWNSIVHDAVQDAVDSGRNVEWDIWNEPNLDTGLGYFWPAGHLADFYETWRQAYNTIKGPGGVDPDAVIVGPSIAGYSPEPTGQWIKDFLTYCSSHSCLPTVLSWHENSDPTNIAAHVSDIKSWMASHGISINRISINEWCHYNYVAHPGPVAAYLERIEACDASVESAAHTCWDGQVDNDGYSDCENQTLGGELTHAPDRNPRAGWWAYKGYAEITGRKLTVTQGSPYSVFAIAGIDTPRKYVRALLGRNTTGADVSVDVRFTSIPPDLQKNGKVRVVAYRVDDYADHRAVLGLSPVINASYPVASNQATVTLPSFGPTDAYIVKLFRMWPQLDWDGNKTTEKFSAFRATDASWYASDGVTFSPAVFGSACDVPSCGDYDGDGRTDRALFTPSGTYAGWWHIKYSSGISDFYAGPWGCAYDIPLATDFNGDGITERAYFRTTDASWGNSCGVTFLTPTFGSPGDIPLVGDYDGDGITDRATFTPTNVMWHFEFSSSRTTQNWGPWGNSTDIPVCGDFNGDGVTDTALWRPSSGNWIVYGQTTIACGVSGDIPVIGDYDADGMTDRAVFTPSGTKAGWWKIKYSSGQADYYAGPNGCGLDVPITNGAHALFGRVYLHPVSQTKQVGQSVTFTVAAFRVTGYQWYRKPSGGSWAAISGATSASYTRSNLQLTDNGSQYYCAVSTTPGCSSSSAPATLTVTN